MTDPVPSKDQVWTNVRIMDELGDYDACLSPEHVRQLFENAHRLLQDLRREIVRWENAHKILLADIERHKRDVKLLEIVGKEQEQRIAELKRPAHEREPPHCSNCSCGMTAPEPGVSVDRAFELGWRIAAEWAGRDDLIADIGSPVYEQDKSKALSSTQPPRDGQ
jgi:hypothetical protein